MRHLSQFQCPVNYKMILEDSSRKNTYYGLDEFDFKYLRIILSKFDCTDGLQDLPDRVKMEMNLFEWNDKKSKFILNIDKNIVVQLNRLVSVVNDHSYMDE